MLGIYFRGSIFRVEPPCGLFRWLAAYQLLILLLVLVLVLVLLGLLVWGHHLCCLRLVVCVRVSVSVSVCLLRMVAA